MAVKTAVGKTTKPSDFVTIPRVEYEALLRFKKPEKKSLFDAPLISKKEQRDIEKRYKKPVRREEYKDLKSRVVPRHYLTGKAAERLDKLVNDGLKEYKSGKTEPMDSFLKREYPRLYKRYAH